MEVSLTNMRDIGFKKIAKFFLDDKFEKDIDLLHKELITVKLPVYSFLKYWDAIDYCSNSVNGLKNWGQAFEPLICIENINEPTKRRFRQKYTALFDKFGASASIDTPLVLMLKDIAVKIELLIAIEDDLALYDNIVKKVYKEIDINRLLGIIRNTRVHEFLNVMFEWGYIAQTEYFLDKSTMDLLILLCTLDNEEFILKLSEGNLWE